MPELSDFFTKNDKRLTLLRKIGQVADQEGYAAYLVGGAIRDQFLGRHTQDIDITVEGNGIEFAHLIAKTLGIKKVIEYTKFGTAMLPYYQMQIEIATARSENYAPNSRKPQVTQSDLIADLARRDFTINAMAMSINEDTFFQLIDHYGGLQDLNQGIIRTPLEPRITFAEDPLRMLRGIRFATQLNFEIEQETFTAIPDVRDRMAIISQERITEELIKILKSAQKPSCGFLLMDRCGLLEIILPEIAQMKGLDQKSDFHHKDVFRHSLQVLDNVAEMSDKLELRFTALVHDIAKPHTKKFIEGHGWTFYGHELLGAKMIKRLSRRLKLPNKLRDYAMKLTRLHLRPIALAEEGVTDSAVRRLLVDVGDDLTDLITLCRADITTKNPQKASQYQANFDRVERLIEKVRERDKMRAFQSPVKGDEIMSYFDLEPGPAVGYIKNEIEEAILDGKIDNTHADARAYMETHKDHFLEKIQEKLG